MAQGMTTMTEERTLPAEVQKAYDKYLIDHRGDLSDVQGLAETLFNAGARTAIAAMVSFSDLLPLVGGLERRIGKIRQVLEGLEDS